MRTISGRRTGAFTILMCFGPTAEHHRVVEEYCRAAVDEEHRQRHEREPLRWENAEATK
jgi:hypothetical protein